MTEALHHVLEWVNAHPLWAQVLLFVVAMVEGLFLIGAFVPAAIVLFGMGALVAVGAVDLWSSILISTVGAITGDGLSFWLGRRFGYRLFESRFLQEHPTMVARGRRFFARHGGKGIIIARFLGPIRAVLPSLAGASGMPVWLFLLADSIAAVAWSAAYIVPGVVFGASLGLAAEVAGRLAVLLLALVALVWLGVWATLLLSRLWQARAAQWIGALLDWSRSHRRLGKFGAALADPDQPETPILALLALILIAVGVAWLNIWASPTLHPYPFSIDAAVFQAMRDLHTPEGLVIARALVQFSRPDVYLPVAIAALLALVMLRKRHAAAHWLAALAFAGIIAMGLHATPTLPPPLRFFGLQARTADAARDLVMATVIFGFMPVLLGTGAPRGRRALYFGAATVLVLVSAAAQLYLGAQWYSIALFCMVLGAVWVGLLALGYRRHTPDVIATRSFLLPVLLVFVAATAWQWHGQPASGHAPPPPTRRLDPQQWLDGGWQRLAQQRQDIAGRPKQPLDLQWAAPLQAIESRLRAAGWLDTPRPTALNALRWLTASTPIEELPVLPQVHAGQHQHLVLRLPVDHSHQYLVRLWPSSLQLSSGEPVWLGNICAQEARSFYRLWRYPVTVDTPDDIEPLLAKLESTERRRANGVWLLRTTPAPAASE